MAKMHKNADSECDESEEKVLNGNEQVVHLVTDHEMEIFDNMSDEEDYLTLEEISMLIHDISSHATPESTIIIGIDANNTIKSSTIR